MYRSPMITREQVSPLHNKKATSRLRSLVLKTMQAVVLVEIVYPIYWGFTRHGHGVYWSHYGWIAVIVVMAVAQVIDLITSDTIDDRYFFDRSAEKPDFEAEVDEVIRRFESVD